MISFSFKNNSIHCYKETSIKDGETHDLLMPMTRI